MQNANIVRAPQPETVKDYRVSCLTADGGRHVLASVTGNFQRVNRHRFEPVETEAVRIEIEATNGIDQARIFEVRCYG